MNEITRPSIRNLNRFPCNSVSIRMPHLSVELSVILSFSRLQIKSLLRDNIRWRGLLGFVLNLVSLLFLLFEMYSCRVLSDWFFRTSRMPFLLLLRESLKQRDNWLSLADHGRRLTLLHRLVPTACLVTLLLHSFLILRGKLVMSLNVHVALSVAVRVYVDQVEVLVLYCASRPHLVKHQIGFSRSNLARCFLHCSVVLREILCVP